jgi:hypothetical protein
MATQGNYLDVEVEAEQYSDLADALEQWGRSRFLYYVEEKDRPADDYDEYTSIVVDSWHKGPQLRLSNDEKEDMSVDSSWVDIAVHAGYLPHGVIQYTGKFIWYLRPMDDLGRMKDSAESTWETVEDRLDEYGEMPFTKYVEDTIAETDEFVAGLNDYTNDPNTNYDCHLSSGEDGEFLGDEIRALVADGGIRVDIAGVRDDGLGIELTDVRED